MSGASARVLSAAESSSGKVRAGSAGQSMALVFAGDRATQVLSLPNDWLKPVACSCEASDQEDHRSHNDHHASALSAVRSGADRRLDQRYAPAY